jgi:hypothetical protein
MATGAEITEQRLQAENPGILNDIAGGPENARIMAMPFKFGFMGAMLDLFGDAFEAMGGAGHVMTAGGSGLFDGIAEAMQNTFGENELAVTSFDANGVEFAEPSAAPSVSPVDPGPGLGGPGLNGPSGMGM